MTTRPAWAEIELPSIANNVRTMSGLVGASSKICAVVKADAYGHGAVPVARAAVAGGAEWLAVALVEEALELRRAGLRAPILVFGAPQPGDAKAAIDANLDISVFDERTIRAFAEAGRNAGSALRLHLKIDTGMNRVGCRPDEAADLAALISGLRGVELAGVYSHFADADNPDQGYAHLQLDRFLAALNSIHARGIAVPLRHIANSAAALWLPESRLDMVRMGIALYGLRPDAARAFPCEGFSPALSVKARVTRTSTIEEGASVSYGRTWKASRASRIATIPIGYADGYPRTISGRTWAGFEGARLPQVGRICMDMCMFDASEAGGLETGSVVTLLGPGGPSLDEVAALAGTINYEISCLAGLRLPRIYRGEAS